MRAEMPPPPPQPEIARVERAGAGAWFEARVESTAANLRVFGAAPGDVLHVQRRAQDPAWGDIVGVVSAGPGRRVPACPHHGRCGGCHWLQLDDTVQRRLRSQRLCELLADAHIDTSSIVWTELASPEALGYRCRARLQVDTLRPEPAVGFHGAASWPIVDVAACPLFSRELAEAYHAVRAHVQREPLPDLTGLEITALPAAAGALVYLNPRDRAPAQWPGWGERLLQSAPRYIAGIAVRLGRADGRPEFLGVRTVLGLAPDGHPVAAAARGFVQPNLGAAVQLAALLAERLQAAAAPRIVELHAGAGLFGWRLAAGGARVTASEWDPLAVEAGHRMPPPPLGSWDLALCEARAAVDGAGARDADALVADPPRAGLGDALAHAVVRHGARRVALISCSAPALACDVARLARGGYRVQEIVLADFFPQTRHTESAAILTREVSP